MKKYLNMTTNLHLKCACIFSNLPVPFSPLQFLFSSRVLRNVPFGNPSKLLEDEEHQMCTVYESLSRSARVVLIVLLNDERLENIEDFRIKERKYINRVRACLNAAEKCNVFYKADTTLTSFLQPASPHD